MQGKGSFIAEINFSENIKIKRYSIKGPFKLTLAFFGGRGYKLVSKKTANGRGVWLKNRENLPMSQRDGSKWYEL